MVDESSPERPDDAATIHESSPTSRGADAAPDVPGYECVRVIGRGGMGVVWEAIELRLERRVALKVQAQESDDVAAMWGEAKLAAHVNDAGVVTVLDVGRALDGRAYYTMELVEGTDLAAVLRDGKLAHVEAVRIASEIAQAVAAAHDKGIVHRDLKPRNVMIDKKGRARVLDFGLALRHATAPTPTTFAGSPPYMAPEQVRAAPVGPEVDVYAIGVMLYEMLAGRRPFAAPEQPALLYSILFEPPPPLSSFAAVPSEVEAVVVRCLAKDSSARFSSAHELADALDGLRDGKASRREERPVRVPRQSGIVPKSTKPTRDQAQRVFRWSWSFSSSPEALWPHVADTDSFNEAVGLSPMDVEPGRESPETMARLGHASTLGLDMRWREYPFEWIRNREHTVFRWYREGPLEALWNKVELRPRSDGGTDLTHEIAVIPRGVLGRVATLVEIGQRLRRAMDRVYRHVDEVVASGKVVDPYDARHEPTGAERVRIEVGHAKLIAAGFERDAVDHLAELLLHGPARKLARMRPFALAPDFGTSRERALDLMLHAAHLGLLEIAWDLVCPTCMVAHDTRSHLEEVTSHAQCVACETEYDRDLGSSVELVLRPHPDVRATKLETFCAGSPSRRSHVLVQLVLEPGEVRTITAQLPPGEYSAAAFGVAAPADVAVSPVGYGRTGEIAIDEHAVVARPAVFGDGGEIVLRFVNETADERSVRIEKRAAFADSVPATVALTHPTFRDFFASELLSYGQLLGVSHLYFVALDASDGGALFLDRGDAAACASLRAFEEAFEHAVRDEGGSRLPGPLETMVAAFPSGSRALRATLALLDAAGPLPVRAAIHGGRCLALTREARIEYFGETLHRALWLATAAEPRSLVLSQVAAADRDLASVLHAARDVTTKVDVASSGPYQGRRIVRVALAGARAQSA
ncbi:MAG TPA: protein kinase [Polyangiaceae bacterium]|jgi:serine/threonine protein kinase